MRQDLKDQPEAAPVQADPDSARAVDDAPRPVSGRAAAAPVADDDAPETDRVATGPVAAARAAGRDLLAAGRPPADTPAVRRAARALAALAAAREAAAAAPETPAPADDDAGVPPPPPLTVSQSAAATPAAPSAAETAGAPDDPAMDHDTPVSVPPKAAPPRLVATNPSATGAPLAKLHTSAPSPGMAAKVTPLPSPSPRAVAVSAPADATRLPGAGTGAGMAAFKGAGAARFKRRHFWLVATFLMLVVTPAAIVAWYLWTIALDQYDSRLGFSVQREETGSAIEMLGGITELTGSSSSDTDILYKFIQSSELVRKLQAEMDLVAIYTRPEDPAFSMPANPSLEDIEAHWNRKVDVFYDNASRLIEVRALAFTREDALRITEAIASESTRMLNDLSAIAREDTTRYAREELDKSLIRLKAARQALTAFRVRSQIVDPAADVQGRMGLLNTLLAQQATALIDLDLLASNTSAADPRYTQAQKRVEVIEARIRAERARFGDQPAEEDERYADLVAEFEALSVDMEFAQRSYLSALTAFDIAAAEAQRKSRYLATYQNPSLAEEAKFPQRFLIFGLATGFLFAVWSIMVLVYYTLRDRK